MWKQQLRTVIQPFLAHEYVPVVLSPDMDGVVATLILHRYATQFNQGVRVIGTYDSSTLMATTSFDQAKDALWVDIDCRFEGAAHIGQHLLGDVSLNPRSFNPNHTFQEHTIYRKYPWGTAQLMLWGLFDSEEEAFPIFRQKFGLAKSAFLHCDSTYNNCVQYQPNSQRWAQALFGDNIPSSLQNVLDGTYHANALKVHRHMLNEIGPYVRGSGSGTGWQQCAKQQTVQSLSSLASLFEVLAKWFRCSVPLCVMLGAMPVFKGTLERWTVDQLPQITLNPHVVSHAIINRRTISVTVK